MDAVILFFGCFFEINNYQSIEYKSIQEVEKNLRERENVKFLVIPEERIGEISVGNEEGRPIVICITKGYKIYRRERNYNQILFSQKTAREVIERWQ